MEHCCILIPHPRDEEMSRGRRKSEEISRQLQCWRWEECKLPNKVHDAKDCLKSITTEIVFEFNPTSQELCLLNLDNTVAGIVRVKDREIKELNKRVAELEVVANKDLCMLPPIKADAAVTKEQGDCGATCKEQGDYDGKEKERKDEKEENQDDEEMDEERKDNEEKKTEDDEQKKKKTKEAKDDKEGKKKDGEDEEGKEKEYEKAEERKNGNDDKERDHDTDNEYNDTNEENSIKQHVGQVLCHYEIEMNKKLEAISRKLDFGQDMNFGEQDYGVMEEVPIVEVGEESDVNESPSSDPFGGRKDYRDRELITDEK
ncbi:hypothetical protein CDL12_24028 [Handroanthus impetiginosus]|uniref:Ubiquitinyl hydrolase 1 n=1 Tax=Handroanthus impetiginosus TaxID=429701 RepID=A0A2G9GDT8_9LAMI|nr:hypothetical protein CDL12_24028 [Handroanthus impetiginosus]